jgi:catalase
VRHVFSRCINPDPSRLPTASTLSEENARKRPAASRPGLNATIEPLDRVRVDSSGQVLTTNQGVPIADNQNSLKYGVRGPALLEDFILREKITHFDHERIPERIVHARGSGAHGFFECYEPLTQYAKAAPFQEAGKITPVFVRFSTVQGERGSKDTARDVRGFAVKFYTDEGNWDLVGNNIPVFFIQDAMKFPDLVHAVKPEPHHQMPQAASAHDTFWDFVSLMPESTHMLMWVMSDRAIPRSYATMQGFGVHSFRMVNEAGESVFVKFHWTPIGHAFAGVGRGGEDLRRRPRTSTAATCGSASRPAPTPSTSWRLQIFTEEQAEQFSFDILDATKIIPEELVPLHAGGPHGAEPQPRQLLRRDRAGRLLHGARGARHRLLQRPAAGRPHPLVRRHADHAPGRAELPRDPDQLADRAGAQQPARRLAPAGHPRGRVSYEPNSLAGGCPFQAGAAQGFVSVPARIRATRSRARCAPSPRSSPTTTRRRGCSSRARRRWSRTTSPTPSASS